MPLQPGTRLGPYEILSAIGAGGMGDVYRAKDTKLKRDVALKVLPDAVATDPQRLARFQREAQVLASLNHPNIAHIYGVEDSDSTHALIMELVEGPTLAIRIATGAIPLNEALSIARQIAEALEVAHAHGVIHRDLKPSNIKLRPDGVAKVLDFGLAKLAEAPTDSGASSTTTAADLMTSVGTILGTAAYMSPEQGRGKPVDKRTDIWACGCVLFEMLTGRAPFTGETVSDIIAAILSREPDLTRLPASTPASIRRLLKRCLEKDAKRRLHDIADARIEIEDALTVEPTAAEDHARRRKRTGVSWVVGGLVAGGLLAAYAMLVARRPVSDPPVYHQVTFRRGSVTRARFGPDGQTVVYSAAWERPPVQLLSTRINSSDTSVMPLPSASVLSISGAGKMAVLLPRGAPRAGTLAEVSLGGQAPRELVNDVLDADWAPGGDALAITHVVNGSTRLEYPSGTVLYSAGLIQSPRFSPKGDVIAFIESDSGSAAAARAPEARRLSVVDLKGRVTVVTKGWGEMATLAWNPSGDEIWFSAREMESRSGGLALHAVTLSGAHRLVASLPGIVILQQISPDGRVLLSHEQWPVTMMCQAPGTTREQDVSWLDYSKARDMSPDGRLVLFDENGLAEGASGGVYVRKVDGSAAVRIGDGQALSLSPDGATAITRPFSSRQLSLVPTGPGQTHIVRSEGLRYLDARWFPDGTHLLVAAEESNRPPFLSVQDVAGGVPRRLVEGAVAGAVSPDGRIVASMGAAGSIVLTPVDGGQSRTLTGVPIGASIARWEASGRYLFLKASGEFGVDVFRVDVATGHSEVWRRLAPSDVAGVSHPTYSLAMTADGRSYCYSYGRRLSALFVVNGLK